MAILKILLVLLSLSVAAQFLSLSVAAQFFSLSVVAQSSDGDCVYTVYVRTGSIIKGGTDSTISLGVYDRYGDRVEIKNLEAWGGLMKPGHNYFERGNLDIFSGRGKCLGAAVCAINLTSDGSGPHHGWYCNYVEVTFTGAHTPCGQEQWLATYAAPYNLTALRNYCPAEAHRKKINSRSSIFTSL